MALHAVTGAFGYSGSYLARDLLRAGHRVRTLTNSPRPDHPLWGRVECAPLDLQDGDVLVRALEGVEVLYNTYWVRFSKAGFSQAAAVTGTEALFAAARAAGTRRVVHVSITNPSADSPYEYFRGKARLEEALRNSGLSHAILRPAVLFGGDDILVNNIAWMLRRFPVFGVFGRGDYRLRPIHVEDFSRLAVAMGSRTDDVVLDAVGPETWAFRDLVAMLGEAVGHPRRLVSVPAWLGLALAWAVGRRMGDVVLTGPEIRALMDGLLVTSSPATGSTRLSNWARAHADTLGLGYANELARRRQPPRASRARKNAT